jgi:hypothetical protein
VDSLRQYLGDKNPPGFILTGIFYNVLFNLKYHEPLIICIKNKREEISAIKKLLPVLIVFIVIASMGALFDCSGKQTEMGQTRSGVNASETVAAAKETVAASKVKELSTKLINFQSCSPMDGKQRKYQME